MDKKKALFVANYDHFHIKFHLHHIKHLEENGYEVSVVASGNDSYPPSITKYDLEFGRTPINKRNIVYFKNFRKLLNTHYDLIYFSTPVIGAYGRLATIGKHQGRIIYAAHGYNFYEGNSKLKNFIFRTAEKLLCYSTDCTFTINKEDYEAALKYKFPCKEIYNVDGVGIDTSVFKRSNFDEKTALRNKLGYADDLFIMIYPAELTERKNQVLLFEVMEELVKRHSNVKLLLAGSGSMMDKYKNIVASKGLNGFVEFLGYRNDVQDLLRASDVLLASSINEGLPINMIEGLASGLPVVATATRGQVDLIKEGENGFLFRLNDSDKAVSDLCRLIEDKNIYEAMATKAAESAKQYDAKNVVGQYDKIWGLK